MILVVGGAGFIGSHMLKCLERAGKEFITLDNLERGHKEALRGTRLIQADLRDLEATKKVFRENEIDLVYHFAAYIEVGESVEDPAKFYHNNVIGTWNLLEAMRETNVGQIVFSSTAAVYGEPQVVPIPEDHQKNPTNPYGASKLAVERMLTSYESAYGIRSVCLRYFNAAGSDPDCEIGEVHHPETHLIPRILLNVRGKADFKVFGDDYETPDGTCIRDYVHVNDLADAHLLAADYLGKGGKSDAFNLGNGQGFSVREVIESVKEVTGHHLQPEAAPRREGDPARLIASNEKAKSTLGWEPKFTNIKTMVQHAWNWQQKHPNGYQD